MPELDEPSSSSPVRDRPVATLDASCTHRHFAGQFGLDQSGHGRSGADRACAAGWPLGLAIGNRSFTAQLAAILDRRQAECGNPPPRRRAWVFPSQASASGHLRETKHPYARISETAGAKFWFQGMRNCYLAVAERDLLLPSSLTSRLLNRAPVGGIAAGHPEDWTIEQLREPAQRIANRIEELMNALAPQPALAHDPQ